MYSENKEQSIVDVIIRQFKHFEKALNSQASELDAAPLVERASAYMIDRVILWSAAGLFLKPLLMLLIDFDLVGSSTVISLLSGGLAEFVYAGYFYPTHQATPGKMIFRLRVVRCSGAKLGFLESGLRDGIGKLISGVTVGIGYLIAFSRPDRRALHDLIFRTKVILVDDDSQIITHT